MTNDDRRKREALFRHSVLGPLLSRPMKRGEFKRMLKELAAQYWTDHEGRTRQIAAKTLEEWFYRHRHGGFDGLLTTPRKDRGQLKAVPEDLRELVVAMKREDPGRSAVLIERELVLAGRLRRGQVSVCTLRRLLRREGLSGPRLELDRPVRLRWQAERCGELWQTDAVHGPMFFDPASGRAVRVKIFALIDDRSRLVPYLRASFHETQVDFLTVLLGAVQRRGIPRGLLADNHASFRGSDTQLACAQLGIRQHFARPYDGPAKGKIERWWRHLRAHVLDRLDREKVKTLDELNVRLWAWVEGEYHKKPHESLSGKTPLQVWEEDAEAIRWVEDEALLDKAFTATIQRLVKNDSTCEVRGRTYEVPTHLRGRKVTIGYGLLTPERLWVQDGSTRMPLREIDPEGNSRRSRRGPGTPPAKPAAKTGLNAAEAFLKQVTQPTREEGRHDA